MLGYFFISKAKPTGADLWWVLLFDADDRHLPLVVSKLGGRVSGACRDGENRAGDEAVYDRRYRSTRPPAFEPIPMSSFFLATAHC
jgi:hypothetical protein